MDKNEYARLKRLVLFSWALLCFIIVVVVFAGTIQLKKLKDQIQVQNVAIVRTIKQLPTPKDGNDGSDGATPACYYTITQCQGRDGASTNGRDGQGVTPDQVVAAANVLLPSIVEQYFRLNPVQTVVGGNGVDGLTQEIQVDTTSCQIKTKYTIADAWNAIAQLPKPCAP